MRGLLGHQPHLQVVGALVGAVLLTTAAGCSSTHDTGQDGGASASSAVSGDRLPDVTMTALRSSGQPIDLGSLKGPAVVNLWANWCAPCREEMPIIEKFHQQEPDVKVIGVNTLDTQPALARQVADRAGVTYPLVVDQKQSIVSAARGLPQTLLVDARGRIVYTAPGGFKSLAQLRALVAKKIPATGAGG